ncbi:MAG: hypothetical protein V4805_17890 [Pseudomonadota bacterium]
MIHAAQYRRIVLASAWYDLIVTIGFATPWTFALIYANLSWLAQALGLAGDFPAFAPMHVLMGNMLGVVVTIWAVVRIRDPQVVFGRYDAVARLLFASWQIYAVMHGASALILGFAVFEILFCLLQSLPLTKVSERQ